MKEGTDALTRSSPLSLASLGAGSPAHGERHRSSGDGLDPSFNRDGSTPIYFPPDFCPPGQSPTLVKTGGEDVCPPTGRRTVHFQGHTIREVLAGSLYYLANDQC